MPEQKNKDLSPPNHISEDRASRFMDDDESLAQQVVIQPAPTPPAADPTKK